MAFQIPTTATAPTAAQLLVTAVDQSHIINGWGRAEVGGWCVVRTTLETRDPPRMTDRPTPRPVTKISGGGLYKVEPALSWWHAMGLWGPEWRVLRTRGACRNADQPWQQVGFLYSGVTLLFVRAAVFIDSSESFIARSRGNWSHAPTPRDAAIVGPELFEGERVLVDGATLLDERWSSGTREANVWVEMRAADSKVTGPSQVTVTLTGLSSVANATLRRMATRILASLSLVATILIVLAIPALQRGTVVTTSVIQWDGRKGPRSAVFDWEPVNQLSRVRPQLLILGNSNAARVDEQLLTSATGLRAAVLSDPGSNIEYWYLRFKNHVLEAEIDPEVMFVFYLDGELVADGHLRDPSVHGLARDVEPAFVSISEADCRTPSDRIRGEAQKVIEAIYPLAQQYNPDAVAPIVDSLMPGWVMRGDREGFHERMGDRLDFRHFRSSARSFALNGLRAQERKRSFNAEMGCSLVHHMLALAERTHQKMVFGSSQAFWSAF